MHRSVFDFKGKQALYPSWDWSSIGEARIAPIPGHDIVPDVFLHDILWQAGVANMIALLRSVAHWPRDSLLTEYAVRTAWSIGGETKQSRSQPCRWQWQQVESLELLCISGSDPGMAPKGACSDLGASVAAEGIRAAGLGLDSDLTFTMFHQPIICVDFDVQSYLLLLAKGIELGAFIPSSSY